MRSAYLDHLPSIRRSLDEFCDLVARLQDRAARPLGEEVVFSCMIAESCRLTSQSITLLLAYGRLWDADMLIRSIYEGTAKLCFLTDGDAAERAVKMTEYATDIPDAMRVKKSDRVSKLLKDVRDPTDPQWDGLCGIQVDAAEAEELRKRYPRDLQRRLNHRWSFHEIIFALKKSSDPVIQRFVSLSHGYGNGSHLCHQDWNGVGMIWERDQREAAARAAVHDAHAVRIMTDLLIMALLRAHAIAKITGGPDEQVAQGWEAVDAALAATRPLIDRWAEIEYGPAD